jgi:molecular chaperone HtpG
MDKDKLKDLIMFYSSHDKLLVTLKEYVDRMPDDQKAIYYACGESVDKVDLLPQVEAVKDKYEVLYCTEYVDEFALKVLGKYNDCDIINVCTESVDVSTEEEKETLKKENEEAKDMFSIMKEAIPEVKDIRFTNNLKNHPVCLSTQGEISVEMEKAMNAIPNESNIKADKVLEINATHDITKKLKDLYANNKEELKEYAKVLYAEARLIEGLTVENPTEISNIICKYLAN